MGYLRNVVAPRLLDFSMRRAWLADYRARVLAPARGEVLEIGFGSGANLPFYPETVTSIVVIEPDPAMLALARDRLASTPAPLRRIVGVAEAIPAPDHSFDTVVSTLTLCSVRDPTLALAEIRRVLRPGGRFLFLEHGLADSPGLARWQRRISPLFSRLPCGCSLDRDVSQLIAQARFSSVSIAEAYAPGALRLAGLLSEGEARRGAEPTAS